MKQASLVILFIGCCAIGCLAQLSVSVASEPTLTPQQGKLSLETDLSTSYSVTSATSLGIQFGYADSPHPLREYLAGVQHTIFDSSAFYNLPGMFVLMQGGTVADRLGWHPIGIFGAGLSWEITDGWSVSVAVDVNKQKGAVVWPSAVFGLTKTFEIRKRRP